ncbi:MAG: cation:proton antiporter [Planctomycetota bacterium]
MLELGLILLVGVGAQIAASRLRIPSILLLLIGGLLVGPLSTLRGEDALPWLDPSGIFGDVLKPLVGLSVAVILFEGGLTLRFSEIERTRRVVMNLCTFGALVTWFLAAAAAWILIPDMTIRLALLIGAILIVTGPTVIIPMLAHIRPKGPAGAVLKWEGIVTDPIGASIAVIVFEVLIAGQESAANEIFSGLGKTIVAGGLLGALGAWLLRVSLVRDWVPEHLHNAASLLVVIMVYAGCDAIQHESGLLGVTLMGVILANQKTLDVRHILEFKENLRVLLISALFVVLSADLTIEDLSKIGPGAVAFALALVLIVRPVGIWLSTLGQDLSWPDRIFMMAMAPRGIVAAAVASLFGLELARNGEPNAEVVAPTIFVVILVTVSLYGTLTPIIARRIGLSEPDPQGIAVLGAHAWSRSIAAALQARGIRVLLIDSNAGNVSASRMQELPTYRGNALAEHAIEEIDLSGIGRLLALTPNDEVNALVCQRFGRVLGRQRVWQLPPAGETKRGSTLSRELRGRMLFDQSATYGNLASRVSSGHVVKSTRLSDSFTWDSYRTLYGANALALFVISESGNVRVAEAGAVNEPKPGDTVVGLVDPESLFIGSPFAGDDKPNP